MAQKEGCNNTVEAASGHAILSYFLHCKKTTFNLKDTSKCHYKTRKNCRKGRNKLGRCREGEG